MNSLKRTLFFLNILFFAYGVSLAQTNKVIRIVRNGSIFNSNFLTIQSAVDAAIWKDKIEISGSFNEYVHIKNKQYLTIKNINGKTATITSSFLLQSSNYDYDDYDNYYQSHFSSGFNYKMFSNKIKRKAAILAVRNDRTSNNLFRTYNTKEAL